METPPQTSWLGRVTRKLKSKSSTRNLRDGTGPVKTQPRKLQRRPGPPVPDEGHAVNELGEYETYSIFSEASTLVERTPDYTGLLHGLSSRDSSDSLRTVTDGHLDPLAQIVVRQRSERHERMIESLPGSVWQLIASFLSPSDAAYLAIASTTLQRKLGQAPLEALRRPENDAELIRFLNHMDKDLPDHLLCFPCGKYHLRTTKGHEKLMKDYVNHPVFNCPKVYSTTLPRTRLTHGRELPYAFVQLALRYAKYTPEYGIPVDSLFRKWKDPQSGWTHTSRYMVHEGRLLMRIRSEVFAGPKLTETALRHLLYERNEYMPYFSVCAHWRDGDLMPMCKCALSHIPEPPTSYLRQLKNQPSLSRSVAHPGYIVRQCDDCRPARRCPECPAEYLIEINLAEDKTDSVNRFKHALVVTRWSDLGDGSSPTASQEWCAVNGMKADYDSFSQVGRRAVAGVFESKMNGVIPPQRMISLNPKNKKEGIDGNGWY